MHKNTYLLFSFIFLFGLILLSCDNKGVDPNLVDFYGITVTNESGYPISSIGDDDDWGCDQKIYPPDTTSPVILPRQFCIYPAYPNPFNGYTTITFAVPIKSVVTITVKKIINISQRTGYFKEFTDEYDPGVHTLQWGGNNLDAGLYQVTIHAGDWTDGGQVLLIYPGR